MNDPTEVLSMAKVVPWPLSHGRHQGMFPTEVNWLDVQPIATYELRISDEWNRHRRKEKSSHQRRGILKLKRKSGNGMRRS